MRNAAACVLVGPLVLGCTKPSDHVSLDAGSRLLVAAAAAPSCSASGRAASASEATPTASADGGALVASAFDAMADGPTIEIVASEVIAHAIIPSLDVATMKAKVTMTWNASGELRDCRGGTVSADWGDWPNDLGSSGPPVPWGTVKVLRRQGLPGGRQAISAGDGQR